MIEEEALEEDVVGWASEVLDRAGRPWSRQEPAGRDLRFDRRLGRPVLEVRVRTWSPAGATLVRLDAEGGVQAWPASDDADPVEVPGEPLGPDDVALAIAGAEALRRARAERPDAAWAVRETAGRRRRGVAFVRVDLERSDEDDLLTLQLDAATRARLGFAFPRLLRGSQRSKALSRAAAVARARERLQLLGPTLGGSWLAKARLTSTARARTWRLVLVVSDVQDRERRLVVILNARTGTVVAMRLAFRSPASAIDPRAHAEADLRRAALRLGPLARFGPLVTGHEVGGRPVWLAVVHAPSGVWRATIDRGRVRLVRVRAG